MAPYAARSWQQTAFSARYLPGSFTRQLKGGKIHGISCEFLHRAPPLPVADPISAYADFQGCTAGNKIH